MNSYEAKVAARKERQANRADRKRAEASAAFKRSDDAIAGIPPGQPILVGHHSEGRHRRALDRSWNALGKGVALNKEADELERRANTVSRAISSDDPAAVDKLKTKLAKKATQQIRMREVNAAYRKFKKNPETDLSAFDDATQNVIRAYVPAYSWEDKGPYAPYQMSNNSAEIGRCKKRLAELETASALEPAEPVNGDGFTITEHDDDNRIWFEFDAKPSREICKAMRAHGFKWSPDRGAWVRMLNNAGRWAAQQAAREIDTLR